MSKHNIVNIETALAPLVALFASIDEAELHNVEWPLEIPGLLEPFLDPERLAALPESLREAAAAYLGGLPGYREGNFQRAAGQHILRLDLWMGNAQEVDEADIEALGLQEE